MNKYPLDQLPELPLTTLRDVFMRALQSTPLLLEAEPGAGKSTLAPLWALAQVAEGKRVILIQPRILAAQALAQRLAVLLGGVCGERIGYQVPYDSRMNATTQLLVTTPGVFLQYLLNNPELEDVGCVMLDEIHERSVNQDLLWVFMQEVKILREDLQLVLMSATPDPALQQQIPERLFAPGRCFPVTVEYLPPKIDSYNRDEKIETHLLRALATKPDWRSETLLVFLPGWRDIENCAAAIHAHFPGHPVFRLHSRVAASEQATALEPKQGPRVILSTNIAETSLTIADVTLVIDSGLARRVDYEQRTGISRLRTARISMASAEQRRGRAGRVQTGHCIRLWSQDLPLAAADLPEIRTTDYLPLALRVAHWGGAVASLPWLECPNRLALDFAHQQLQLMGLMDRELAITSLGKKVSELGTHPRVAALLMAHHQRISMDSLLLALALHFELPAEDDLTNFIDIARSELARNRHWQLQRNRWLSLLDLTLEPCEMRALYWARAYSERIGYRQESGRYRLNSGISVVAQTGLETDWAVFPVINPKANGHKGLGLALILEPQQQRQLSLAKRQLMFKNNQWQEQTLWSMGGVIIEESNSPVAADSIGDALVALIQEQVKERGMDVLRWPLSAKNLLQRARLIVASQLLVLPDVSESVLLKTLDVWLKPFLTIHTAMEQLPWQQALEFYIGYDLCQQIAQILPEKVELPSGRSVTVDFSSDGQPEISAKLQEFFGCEQLQFAQGRIPLKIHLLSPNGSPLAVTSNLKTFWQQAYPDVRKEMRGRYPRHPWPENPMEHEATALTKKKLAHKNAPL